MSPVHSSNDAVSGLKRKMTQLEKQVNKCAKRSSLTTATGVFYCFTVDGKDANLHRRSAFSVERKEQVKGIRRKGACLRCRLLKRACSGEDPCKTCISAARAAANSKALMWMECIRPTLSTLNIFDKAHKLPGQVRLDDIINTLLDDDVSLDFHMPFALNVDAASSHFARWIASDDDTPSTFSVVGIFSCSTNANLLQNSLDPSLGRDLRLFVFLTTWMYTTGMEGGYQDYTEDEIQAVRDCVGHRLLVAFDALLRPSEMEASGDKLGRLKSLFLLLLGTIVGLRYNCAETMDGESLGSAELEPRQAELLRLLCHYLIYIGKATSLLESLIDEKTLLTRWKTNWDKAAEFTWNPGEGLEMHYRIEPPADWIVSSSEDESLNSIDIDLSEFDSIEQFTQNADLTKCSACGTFWPGLDMNGLCQFCQPAGSSENCLSHSPPFLQDFDLYSGFLFGNEVGSELHSSFDSSLATTASSRMTFPWESPSFGSLALQFRPELTISPLNITQHTSCDHVDWRKSMSQGLNIHRQLQSFERGFDAVGHSPAPNDTRILLLQTGSEAPMSSSIATASNLRDALSGFSNLPQEMLPLPSTTADQSPQRAFELNPNILYQRNNSVDLDSVLNASPSEAPVSQCFAPRAARKSIHVLPSKESEARSLRALGSCTRCKFAQSTSPNANIICHSCRQIGRLQVPNELQPRNAPLGFRIADTENSRLQPIAGGPFLASKEDDDDYCDMSDGPRKMHVCGCCKEHKQYHLPRSRFHWTGPEVPVMPCWHCCAPAIGYWCTGEDEDYDGTKGAKARLLI